MILNPYGPLSQLEQPMIISGTASQNHYGKQSDPNMMILQLSGQNNPFRNERNSLNSLHQMSMKSLRSSGGPATTYEYMGNNADLGRRSLQLTHS